MTLLKTLRLCAGMMLGLLASQTEAATTLTGTGWCKSGSSDTTVQ